MSFQEENQQRLVQQKKAKAMSKSGYLMDVVHERGSESSFEDEEENPIIPFSLTNMDHSSNSGSEENPPSQYNLPSSIYAPNRMPKHIE